MSWQPGDLPVWQARGDRVPGRDPYRAAVEAELCASGCTVRRWRSSASGDAYVEDDDWGIEVPEPRGPVSACTCLHEIGHQLLHRRGGGRRSLQRWQEEWDAWEWALAAYARHGLPGYGRAQADAAACLRYAANKAMRRTRDKPRLAGRILDTYPAWVWRDSMGLVVHGSEALLHGSVVLLRVALVPSG